MNQLISDGVSPHRNILPKGKKWPQIIWEKYEEIHRTKAKAIAAIFSLPKDGTFPALLLNDGFDILMSESMKSFDGKYQMRHFIFTIMDSDLTRLEILIIVGTRLDINSPPTDVIGISKPRYCFLSKGPIHAWLRNKNNWYYLKN